MKIEKELDGRFRNANHKALINLIYTSNQLHYSFIHLLKSHGLSSQQYNVLRVLRGFGSKARSIDFLRKRMLDKNSDMSRIVDRLYIAGLIERVENEKDRRKKDISISGTGLKLLEKIDSHENEMDQLLNMLSPEEVDELNRLLDKIRG